MAPEQWKRQACPQSDVYALGLIAYELVTGRSLIDCMKGDEKYKKALEDKKVDWEKKHRHQYDSDKELERGWVEIRQNRWLHKRTYEWLHNGARDDFLSALAPALKEDPTERIQSPMDLLQALQGGLQRYREQKRQNSLGRRALQSIQNGLKEFTLRCVQNQVDQQNPLVHRAVRIEQ
jgi:serine/threonine protein kinase